MNMDKINQYNEQLMGAPAGVLVLLACIAVGYTLKLIKRFPNDGIPLAVVLCGMIFFALIAPEREFTDSLRIWIARNLILGMIIGFASWLLHNKVLWMIEEKIPWLKGADKPEEQEKPQPEKDKTP